MRTKTVSNAATAEEHAEGITVRPSTSAPLGATLDAAGVNFSVFSEHATAIDLLLFDEVSDQAPTKVIPIDQVGQRSEHYWHVFVPGLTEGQIYGFRAHGAFEPSKGLRFDWSKVLLDPYGRGVVVPQEYSRSAAADLGPDTATAMKSVVVDSSAYDWEGDRPLRHPTSQTIIYELHVRGFTCHPSSGLANQLRGTYAGLVEKIPYLCDLGITAVELLPVFQFDRLDGPPDLVNYWGYAPVSFFSPHRAYSSRQDVVGPVVEFQDMVKALHRAGIEVILDVAFAHTAEGDHRGPTLCFRGLDNPAYYILDQNMTRYANYSNCGNTLNGNHPVVRRLILDSLRYWVQDMHVDGFRLNLASVLSRGQDRRLLANPSLVSDIASDPVLAGTKLIAESWDAAGLHQAGTLAGHAWKEWNTRFRDCIRSFVRGDDGTVACVANRLAGSPEIYGESHRKGEASINFVTCHDGFTLNDLVSYNQKHNENNGEYNHDGAEDNRSWNCGVEGPTDDARIDALRNRQIKNFLTLTMISLGVPMLLMGDEVRRSQNGNNNAYCQDDETSWFDWGLVRRHAALHRFTKLLLARRVLGPDKSGENRISITDLLRRSALIWHGVRLWQPDWSFESHSLALGTVAHGAGVKLHIMMNAHQEPLDFELPALSSGESWRRWIDTSLESPHDITPWRDAPEYPAGEYTADSRSVVVLWANAD